MEITGKFLIDLADHAKRIGTQEAWMAVALQWIDSAEKEIVKMKPVYSAVMEWTSGEASLDALKHIIRTAQNDAD